MKSKNKKNKIKPNEVFTFNGEEYIIDENCKLKPSVKHFEKINNEAGKYKVRFEFKPITLNFDEAGGEYEEVAAAIPHGPADLKDAYANYFGDPETLVEEWALLGNNWDNVTVTVFKSGKKLK